SCACVLPGMGAWWMGTCSGGVLSGGVGRAILRCTGPARMGPRGLDEGGDDADIDRIVLGMPLDCEQPGLVRRALEHLDDAVVGPSGDREAFTHPVDRLVVIARRGHG